MSWNNIIPAWALAPFRAICDAGRAHSEGFNTREEAEAYIASHPDCEFRLLEDSDETV